MRRLGLLALSLVVLALTLSGATAQAYDAGHCSNVAVWDAENTGVGESGRLLALCTFAPYEVPGLTFPRRTDLTVSVPLDGAHLSSDDLATLSRTFLSFWANTVRFECAYVNDTAGGLWLGCAFAGYDSRAGVLDVVPGDAERPGP